MSNGFKNYNIEKVTFIKDSFNLLIHFWFKIRKLLIHLFIYLFIYHLFIYLFYFIKSYIGV